MRHCVAEPLCNSGEVENFLDFSLPVSNGSLTLSLTTPEVPRVCDARRCLKHAKNGIGEHCVHGYTSFLRVEKQPLAVEPVGCQGCRIGNAHAAVAHENEQGL